MKPTPEILAALGITREDVLEALVKSLTNEILGPDTEFAIHDLEARVNRSTQEFIKCKIAEIVLAKCEEVFAPMIESKLADYKFEQTNSWGEKTAESMTFAELLVKQMTNYMLEQVDSRGRNADQARAARDSFTPLGNRITVSIRHYFQTSMDAAMKTILADGAKILTEGIEQAAKTALGDIHQRLTAKVTVN